MWWSTLGRSRSTSQGVSAHSPMTIHCCCIHRAPWATFLSQLKLSIIITFLSLHSWGSSSSSLPSARTYIQLQPGLDSEERWHQLYCQLLTDKKLDESRSSKCPEVLVDGRQHAVINQRMHGAKPKAPGKLYGVYTPLLPSCDSQNILSLFCRYIQEQRQEKCLRLRQLIAWLEVYWNWATEAECQSLPALM